MSDSAVVKRTTRRSTTTSASRGMPPGSSATSASTPQIARRSPKAPPHAPSSTLSVRSCRTRRQRAAPSALRTAISVSRADARASSRFATLVHAISNTNPTAPSSSSTASRMLPTVASWSGTAVIPRPSLCSGYCRASSVPMVRTSAMACSTGTPGFTRPTAFRNQLLRCVVVKAGVYSSGIQIAVCSGNENALGMTPTTSKDTPSSVTFLPMTVAAPPNRCCHRP